MFLLSAFVSIDEFNMGPGTWSFGTNYFNAWVSTSGAVPASINLASYVPLNTFQPGILYRIALSVAPNWHTDAKFLRVVNCTHSSEPEEVVIDQREPRSSLRIFPNPGNGWFAISAGDAPVQNIIVTDVSGKTIYAGLPLAGAATQQIDLTPYAAGVYFVKVYTAGTVLTERLIKN